MCGQTRSGAGRQLKWLTAACDREPLFMDQCAAYVSRQWTVGLAHCQWRAIDSNESRWIGSFSLNKSLASWVAQEHCRKAMCVACLHLAGM